MIKLEAMEARIIACLIEKEITTPDQYPLSLNALTNACNQKSNRFPVMNLSEAEVQTTIDSLSAKRLVSDRGGFGSRVTKYQHRFCNTEFGELKFSPAELAIICELLLRGPQTPGELRSRADRMNKFSNVQEVESVLNQLSNREDGPFVLKLAREPGKRESRYAQLFSETQALEPSVEVDSGSERPASGSSSRLDALEAEVASLRQEVSELKTRLEQLES
ncbi:MAG: DUF480 domain-containing protein [Gammaproteobacteria bacterium]|nr:DUF480 domain-containing protein [Gammaproteobacteria bacterium]MDH5693629.1 DUF480 domain-containing protein [Gammaproteobacteria bacterium]